jgi:hypothetical protein
MCDNNIILEFTHRFSILLNTNLTTIVEKLSPTALATVHHPTDHFLQVPPVVE